MEEVNKRKIEIIDNVYFLKLLKSAADDIVKDGEGSFPRLSKPGQ